MAINRLSNTPTISGSDQIPIGQNSSGQDRRVAASALKEFVQEDFVPAGGILAISGFYSIRKTTPVTIAVGTAYANFTNYESPVGVFPAGRDSIAGMIVVGEFVAARDIAAVMFWVAMTGTWPNTRDLTLGVLVGTDANPYESASKFIGAGRGGGSPISAMFGSPAVNQNNPGGTILAGEKIRLVAKMNTADNLDLTRLTFAVQTLDGI